MSSRPSAFTLTSPGPLRLYSTQELLRLPPPTWLIEGIMPAGGLVGIYGQPGTGKSFLAIDMALSVASGQPWQGRTVQPGYVLYVAAEGGTGIAKRVQAWLDTYQVKASALRIAWLTEALPINSDSDTLERLFERLNGEVEVEPSLIVLDTLARCFEGDENMQEDMGRFIQGVDRMRHDFSSTVIVVHHTRLDAARERGSTAFRGAADTMLAVARKDRGPIILSCNKQKDSEEFEDMELRLDIHEKTESCVVRPSSREVLLVNALRGAGGEVPVEEFWPLVESATNMSRRTYFRELRGTRKSGQILKENGFYRLASDK